jgi:hypothetical protein
MKVPCKNIPTYDLKTKKWSTTSFNDKYELGQFLMDNCFKEPGEYQFDKSFTKGDWIAIGNKFDKNGYYTEFAEDTQEYFDFWVWVFQIKKPLE